ncbi:LacI family DNA-binding transcriptional regulator [Pseudolysinimonas sp.]|uniref:LacI family DNA-binding transcriptional regulator n=1 Tax=Pseudolysinimonas sp. TaxID=2680009 RepID=UPI003F818250
MSQPVAPRALTIADVAARAGVSLSTVSRVMNGNATVDPELAAKVRAAAASLNYSASPLARGLVLGKTQTVAVVVPDLANPTFIGALRGLSLAAAQNDYHVLIADSSENVADERLLAMEARRRCDAIVLVAPRMPLDVLAELIPRLAPVVVINRDLPASPAPIVAADYRAGLIELLEAHLSLGHRHLVFITGVAESASNANRLSAIEDVRASHPDVVVDIVAGGVDFESGYAVADRVLETGATAALAYNDLVAMGLLSALHEKGVRVPDDVSVAGFDDIPFARYTTPPLTTASVPVAELGAHAWARMWDLLNHRAPGHNVFLRPRVELRGSVRRLAAPPAA